MASFNEIDEARKLLTLGGAVSLGEIKRAYWKKAHRYHPDKGAEDEEEMKKINWAYKLLMEYCRIYKFTFTKEDWKRAYPQEAYFEKYGKGWFDGI